MKWPVQCDFSACISLYSVKMSVQYEDTLNFQARLQYFIVRWLWSSAHVQNTFLQRQWFLVLFFFIFFILKVFFSQLGCQHLSQEMQPNIDRSRHFPESPYNKAFNYFHPHPKPTMVLACVPSPCSGNINGKGETYLKDGKSHDD